MTWAHKEYRQRKERATRFSLKEDREAKHIIATERSMHPKYSIKRLKKIAYGHINKLKGGKK